MKQPNKPLSGTIWPPDDAEGAPYAVRVEWDLIDGRWEPSSIKITSRRPSETGPITGTTLRSLPIGKILDVLRARSKALAQRTAEQVDVPDGWVEAWEKGEKPRLGLEHYQRVADAYKAAFAAGASPTKVVADTFHVSSSTAGSWVSRARHKYGLLGDTPMGRAGI